MSFIFMSHLELVYVSLIIFTGVACGIET